MKHPLAATMAAAAVAMVTFVPAASRAQSDAPSVVAIRDARIVPVSGPMLERGTVVLRDGLIEAVGADVAIPAGAWVIDGAGEDGAGDGDSAGLTVYPGLIDSLSRWGVPAAISAGPNNQNNQQGRQQSNGPEDRPATTSWLKTADELDANDARLEQARNAGFTTAVAFPTRGIFAGQGSVINLAGERPGAMVLVPSAGQYIALVPSGVGFPASLMGSIAYVRQTYLDASYYANAKRAYDEDPRGQKRPAYDRALEGVIESPRILLPAGRKVEIQRMLRFAAELGQPAILYGMVEGYRAADVIKAANADVLIDLEWPTKPRDPDPERQETLRTLENRDRAPSTPAALAEAGVRFAFYSGGVNPISDLHKAVKKAIDAGLSQEDAVRAMTLWPAEIFGFDDRLGSIEPGKIANLTVTRGDLFDDATKIAMVFIDGRQYRPPPEPEPAKPDAAKPEPSEAAAETPDQPATQSLPEVP